MPEERRQLEAMVADYHAMIVPRSLQYWLESLSVEEARRMHTRFLEMVDAEVARRGDEDERDGAREDVLFRIGFALGRSLAGVR
jgi:hypothetical protein